MTADGSRIIKRYANRKLYDMRDSRYVTLEQISEMIRRGEEVKVIDNSTKEDLTSVTLAQILFEEERKQSFLPLAALRKIIQTGGDSLQHLVTSVSESAGRVFHRPGGEDEAASEGELEVPAEGEVKEAKETKEADSDLTSTMREFFDGVQHTLDNWQKSLDSNINSAMESVSPLAPLHKEVATLRARIAELESKLAQLEGEAGQADDAEACG